MGQPLTTIAERRARFRALHDADKLFVMPNPWDAGSARLLASCGFEALATTSAGFAWALGKHDQTVTRDELVAHVAELAAATDLPLNVDSERCYPDDPGGVAGTVALLAGAGAAGFSIEDYDPAADRMDDVAVAAERVAVAAAASRGLSGSDAADRAGPRTTSAASTTSTTRSRAWSPIARPAPTRCMHQASRISTRSPPSWPRWSFP